MSTAFVNEVRLIGNLGGSPDYRLTGSGTPVATLQLATTYRNGEKEHTEWHRVVLWKNLAERAQKYLRKGSQIYVAGRLATRQYKDKDGIDRWVTEVIAEQMQMLGKKPNADDGTESGEAFTADLKSRRGDKPLDATPSPEDEHIPF